MSTLVIQIPPRPRLRASSQAPAGADGTGTEYVYAMSPDGLSMATHGRCAASLLPKASVVVAVLADTDVSWHRITLPKAPAARLRAALTGVLEEALLDDAEGVHLAVAPEATAGQPTWIAAVDRLWLTGELAALEKAQVFVDRVVPVAWPDDPPTGHFAESSADPQAARGSEGVTLSWAHHDGVALFSLQGTLARALLPQPLPEGARWSATPAAATTAERWLGNPITVMTPAQRALQASRSLWNLRQFSLARKNRGTRAMRDSWRKFLTPAWRPLRYGLITLVVVQLLGLNLWAAHQSSAISARRQAMVTVVQTAYPQVRAVLDAPAQMQRETDTLRAAAGRPGETDFEPMLQVAAAAWPPDRPPVETLKYEPGKLTLAAAGWSPPQIDQFRNQLTPAGWQVESVDGRLTISRASATTPGRPL
jgi:general secretion pathway protein L